MRILFLTHYFPPEGNAPASRTYEMCKRWVAEGHDVRVITCFPNHPRGVVYPGYRNRPVAHETIDGIKVTRVWTYLAANVGTIKRIANFLSFMVSSIVAGLRCPRPDAVIATSPQFFCGWGGLLLSRIRGVPFLLEIRDIWPESIVAVGAMRNRMLIGALEGLARTMYRASRHIVAVGEGYRQKLIECGVPATKVSVITNGVDPDLFYPREADPAVLREFGLEGRFVCSYVGTIGMASGLDVVLRAAERLRDAGRDDIAFLLVGDGAVRDDLEAEARARGLDRVTFTGMLPKERMPEILAASDACLVHLKRRDLFRTVLPSKIFEAAAMARPIVLGVEGSAAELIREAGAGVCIEPENDEELVNTLTSLADDPELSRRIGRQGHDYITTHYNRDKLAGEYLDIVRTVATRTSPQAVKDAQ